MNFCVKTKNLNISVVIRPSMLNCYVKITLKKQHNAKSKTNGYQIKYNFN